MNSCDTIPLSERTAKTIVSINVTNDLILNKAESLSINLFLCCLLSVCFTFKVFNSVICHCLFFCLDACELFKFIDPIYNTIVDGLFSVQFIKLTSDNCNSLLVLCLYLHQTFILFDVSFLL